MTPAELKTLIEGDPTAMAAANAAHWRDCAARCEAIAPDARRRVSNIDIKRRAIIMGYWAKILLTAEDAAAPADVRGLCVNVGEWVKDVSGATDFDLDATKNMLAGLVAAGMFDQAEADYLDSLANYRQKITPTECRAAMGGA